MTAERTADYLPAYLESLADLADLVVGETVASGYADEASQSELATRALGLIVYNEQVERLTNRSIESVTRLPLKQRLQRYLADPYLVAVATKLELTDLRRPKDPQRLAQVAFNGYHGNLAATTASVAREESTLPLSDIAHGALQIVVPNQVQAEQQAWGALIEKH